ncbi:unnamed protein product, partial [Discosporangium mesarthrocarpum]
FTDDGQPGEGLRSEFLEMLHGLRLPMGVAQSPLSEAAGLKGRDCYYIVPAFFECVIALTEANTPFSLVFRTFGTDIGELAVEFNAFCEGLHPLYPGVSLDGRYVF